MKIKWGGRGNERSEGGRGKVDKANYEQLCLLDLMKAGGLFA